MKTFEEVGEEANFDLETIVREIERCESAVFFENHLHQKKPNQ